ncbi:Transglutaminase-like superfamily protein [Atopomonas hussainii]|uniref:Transglutaminase-like superfamily protein n=1 Tax=Atopomonas hussainii TaxID=1429083 RepID=A0A1H7PKA8_9GAMM|nr:transglutaminase family protein [Atopomonas hussainii]SEL36220.1 Transglutaminase-like superfamily protein [Atopomonas hussainii]
MHAFLNPSTYIDSDHPAVMAFAEQHRGSDASPVAQAVALYYAVRDEIRYNPYVFSFDDATFKASHAVVQGESYCVPKAALLAACARHCGIPARIGLADVRNHLSTPRLIEALGSDVFAMHGFTELYLNERWVKATPTFNQALCRLMKVAPLDFNGHDDSVFHAFNGAGHKHMEYLRQHGSFADVPVAMAKAYLLDFYPKFQSIAAQGSLGDCLQGDMHAEAAAL